MPTFFLYIGLFVRLAHFCNWLSLEKKENLKRPKIHSLTLTTPLCLSPGFADRWSAARACFRYSDGEPLRRFAATGRLGGFLASTFTFDSHAARNLQIRKTKYFCRLASVLTAMIYNKIHPKLSNSPVLVPRFCGSLERCARMLQVQRRRAPPPLRGYGATGGILGKHVYI